MSIIRSVVLNRWAVSLFKVCRQYIFPENFFFLLSIKLRNTVKPVCIEMVVELLKWGYLIRFDWASNLRVFAYVMHKLSTKNGGWEPLNWTVTHWMHKNIFPTNFLLPTDHDLRCNSRFFVLVHRHLFVIGWGYQYRHPAIFDVSDFYVLANITT